MKRRITRLLLAVLILAALVAVGGYLLLGGGRSYSSDPAALRAQFNRDRGKVRLLMVLSPT
jgi:multidrug resistance efflux pump